MPDNQQIEVDNEYVDVIMLKKVDEMEDPVLSPYTGHIYDRVDILRWIALKGKDPIAKDKTLTASMLVSGFAIKKIVTKNKEEIERLEKYIKTTLAFWNQYGTEIDMKLMKGSTPIRTTALQEYKIKVLNSLNDAQLKKAVQDTTKLESKEISERRWFTWFKGTSDTTKVAVEFKQKVNLVKGW